MSDLHRSIDDFLAKLVEFSGVFYVNEDHYICMVDSDDPVCLDINGKATPLMLFHNKMPSGEFCILNPLVEQVGISPERKWFNNLLASAISALPKATLLTAAKEVVKGSDNMKTLSLIGKHAKAIDAKFVKELESIKPTDYCKLFYHKGKRTAQLQSAVMDPAKQDSLGKSIRKRSWTALRGMMEILFDTKDIPGLYKHTADIIAIPETEAKVTVIIHALQALDKHFMNVLGLDVTAKELLAHLGGLADYQKKCQWFNPASVNTEASASVKLPWEAETLPTRSLIPRPRSEVAPRSGLPGMQHLPAQLPEDVDHYGRPLGQSRQLTSIAELGRAKAVDPGIQRLAGMVAPRSGFSAVRHGRPLGRRSLL